MTQKPNLLLIWTDQQRNDTLPCFGNDSGTAPALKTLGEESFVFANAYCAQPICTPSRATVMTGLWPHTHGCFPNNVPLKADTKTIAEMVSDDYDCAYYGKWHLGDEFVAQHGFTDWISIEDQYRPHYSDPRQLYLRSSYHQFLMQNGFPTDSEGKDGAEIYSRPYAAAMGETFTKAAFLGDEASRFLKDREGNDRPFILSVNMLEPHPPLHGPLNDLFKPEDMPVGEGFLVPPSDVPEKKRINYEKYQRERFKTHPLDTEWDWRRLRANYFALVAQLDRAVGRILEALEGSGQADNTIVVFTSDHGEMLGDHAMLGKSNLYDEACKVPLMIKVPWLNREQQMMKAPISQVDLVPTLLELLDQPVPEHLEGVSRAGVLRGVDSMADNNVIIEWNMPGRPDFEGRAIVTADGFKLCLYHDDRNELYDLNSDPCELTNLYSEPNQQDRIKAMAALISTWQKETGDKLEFVL